MNKRQSGGSAAHTIAQRFGISEPTANLSGTVTYRERIALTPDAVMEVKLLDVSRADAPAVTIAEQRIKLDGRQVPITFELPYDPNRISERSRYSSQVRILERNQLRFISSQSYPVIARGHGETVNIIVNLVR